MIKIMLMKKTFQSGEVVFKENEPGLEAFLIRNGFVSIMKTDDGRNVELATRGPGEIIGEMALLDHRPRSATVIAKGTLEVEVITRQSMEDMLQHAPEPLVKIINQLLERLRDANEMVAMYAPKK
jgi:CRP-like cAMP-binding protein